MCRTPQGHIMVCSLSPPTPSWHSKGHPAQPCPQHGTDLLPLCPCRKVNKCYRGRSCPIIVHCRY